MYNIPQLGMVKKQTYFLHNCLEILTFVYMYDFWAVPCQYSEFYGD